MNRQCHRIFFASSSNGLLDNNDWPKTMSLLLVITMWTGWRHTACQHCPAQPSGKNPFGKGLREEVDHRGFSEGRIKGQPRLWGGLWQTAWGPLKAAEPEGWRERIKPGSQRRLFIRCERRRSGFKINSHPLLLLPFTPGVSGCDGGSALDGKAGALDDVLTHILPWTMLSYLVTEKRHLTMSSNSDLIKKETQIIGTSREIKFKIDHGDIYNGMIHLSHWRKMDTNLLWNIGILNMGPSLTPTGNGCSNI